VCGPPLLVGGPPPNARALRSWDVPDGCAVGIGRFGEGREGFVRTHEQARAAHRIGGATRGRSVTHFDDLALEWISVRD